MLVYFFPEFFKYIFPLTQCGSHMTADYLNNAADPLYDNKLNCPGNTEKTIPINTIFPTLFFSLYLLILIQMGLKLNISTKI